eukprot:NODE_357_length_10221_cov_0.563130.p8 type:complete len:112 gc:universal NODE_357_length_10221_cov_0.563130:955-620(-)
MLNACVLCTIRNGFSLDFGQNHNRNIRFNLNHYTINHFVYQSIRVLFATHCNIRIYFLRGRICTSQYRAKGFTPFLNGAKSDGTYNAVTSLVLIFFIFYCLTNVIYLIQIK